MIHYNKAKKALEIDYPVSVKVPKKIGRRIKMIAEGMKEKKEDA